MWSLDGAASLVLRSTPAGLALGLREELDVPPRTLTRLHEQLTLHGRRADASGLFTGIGSLRLGQTELGRWDGVTLPQVTRLCPFELRYLAETGFPHPRAHSGVDEPPLTDLHTHFAGCIRGADLVRIGAEHGVVYPRALLAEARSSREAWSFACRCSRRSAPLRFLTAPMSA